MNMFDKGFDLQIWFDINIYMIEDLILVQNEPHTLYSHRVTEGTKPEI